MSAGHSSATSQTVRQLLIQRQQLQRQYDSRPDPVTSANDTIQQLQSQLVTANASIQELQADRRKLQRQFDQKIEAPCASCADLEGKLANANVAAQQTQSQLVAANSTIQQQQSQYQQLQRLYDQRVETPCSSCPQLEGKLLTANANVQSLQTQVAQLQRSEPVSTATLDQLRADLADSKVQLAVRESELLRAVESERSQSETAAGANLRASALADKLSVLQSEFLTSRTNSAARIAELETQLAAVKERLAAYTTMEGDAEALLEERAAALPPDADDATVQAVATDVAVVLREMPVAFVRRLTHSLKLACRLSASESQLTALQATVTERDGELAEKTLRIRELSERVALLSGPVQGLVDALDASATKAHSLAEALSSTHARVQDESARRQAAEARVASLSDDVASLLRQLDLIGGVRRAVVAMRNSIQASDGSLARLPSEMLALLPPHPETVLRGDAAAAHADDSDNRPAAWGATGTLPTSSPPPDASASGAGRAPAGIMSHSCRRVAGLVVLPGGECQAV